MNVTLTLDDELVRKIRRIAAERGSTLAGLVRESLQKIEREATLAWRKQCERERLERSFEAFSFRVGKRRWTRDELHDRS